jgi:hypothetical protein
MKHSSTVLIVAGYRYLHASMAYITRAKRTQSTSSFHLLRLTRVNDRCTLPSRDAILDYKYTVAVQLVITAVM